MAGTGDRYHVRFSPPPDSTIKTNDATAFVVKNATVQSACPQTCSPGAPGCGWSDGHMVTYTQTEWGDAPNGAPKRADPGARSARWVAWPLRRGRCNEEGNIYYCAHENVVAPATGAIVDSPGARQIGRASCRESVVTGVV